jgi:hypothetical protein
VGRKKLGNLALKKYLVAIPVPCLDRNGRKLIRSRVNKWVQMAEKELTECFGGATPIPSSGTNIIDGKILYEMGQMLVHSTCDSRRDFLKKRNRIQAFVERMGKDLDQKFVFVLACPSDSFLIEIEMRSRLR